MTTIIGLCGSLRHRSFNRMLLLAAVDVAPPGTVIQPESIRDIPLYDGDVEDEQGLPPAVQRLKDRIANADGLLIVTPEYNASLPGVLKNAIDRLSRPAADISRVFRGRPVAIMGATPGPGGTSLSQAAWLPVVRRLGMRPWFEGGVLISDAGRVFDSDGRVTDAATRQGIRTFVEGFAVFAGIQQREDDRRVPAALAPQREPTAPHQRHDQRSKEPSPKCREHGDRGPRGPEFPREVSDVPTISFTGSTQVGRAISQAGAARVGEGACGTRRRRT